MSKNVTVSVTDNALVVSFLSAGEWKVLRVDMTNIPSATFELQEGKDQFSLVMKQEGGAVTEICAFSEKKKALRTLEQVSDALLHGNVHGAPRKCGWFRKLLKGALIVAAALFIIVMLTNKIRGPVNMGDATHTSAPAVQEGVPAPADAVLGR